MNSCDTKERAITESSCHSGDSGMYENQLLTKIKYQLLRKTTCLLLIDPKMFPQDWPACFLLLTI